LWVTNTTLKTAIEVREYLSGKTLLAKLARRILGALAQTVERVQEMSIVRQTALGQGRRFEPCTPISRKMVRQAEGEK
jgi:hypothetical protein